MISIAEENCFNLEKALDYRLSLIEKYDPNIENEKNKQEINWISHLLHKMDDNWVPEDGEVTLEVNKTISYGLYLRRQSLTKIHEAVTNIEYSEGNQVISVDFSKK